VARAIVQIPHGTLLLPPHYPPSAPRGSAAPPPLTPGAGRDQTRLLFHPKGERQSPARRNQDEGDWIGWGSLSSGVARKQQRRGGAGEEERGERRGEERRDQYW